MTASWCSQSELVLVDEIDLHLHANHQYGILPDLLKMFPKIQFVVTTHAPLFVLGMNRVFGESGFDIYRLPDGQQISPETFSEFGNAYQVFTSSSKFSDDVQTAIKESQSPILYVEGDTDVLYLRKAAELLGYDAILGRIDLRDGGGDRLKNVWNAVSKLPEELVPRSVMVLHDCDFQGQNEDVGHRHRRTIPRQDGLPIGKGIENLFSKDTLEEAQGHKPEYIDIDPGRNKKVRGEYIWIPDEWTVNGSEKTNLCNWLCENGTVEDFQYFKVIFDLLSELLENEQST